MTSPRSLFSGGDPADPGNDNPQEPKLYTFDPNLPDTYYRYEEEVMEAASVAIFMSGGPGVVHVAEVMKAIEAFSGKDKKGL